MKLILSLFIALSMLVTAFGVKHEIHNSAPKVYQDSPPAPKYWIHFSMRIDSTLYMKAIDTCLLASQKIGSTLSFDEAVFWREAHYRALLKIDQRIKKDTVKIQGR